MMTHLTGKVIHVLLNRIQNKQSEGFPHVELFVKQIRNRDKTVYMCRDTNSC